jgi:7-carboxy-7-deazaguanine synthase
VIYPLSRDGIYWTIQGEGTQTGVPMVFVRLAGCSVGCAECDTDYRVASSATVDEIAERVLSVTPSSYRVARPWVWITGGEPCDHDLAPLISELKKTHLVALCTSGEGRHAKDMWPGCWVSLSPHRVIDGKHGSEVKLVPGLGNLTWNDLDDLSVWRNFPIKWVQPLAGEPAELSRAIAYVLTHPGVQLSTQAHKVWSIP